MPNRIIKESICTSANLDCLSPEAEVFFYRLLVNCDDYGRTDGRLPVLRSRCFPLRVDSVKDTDIEKWLNNLVQHKLILTYSCDGSNYIQVCTWDKHQQIRAKRSKYPSPDGHCNHMLANDSSSNQLKPKVPVIQSNPIQSESESKGHDDFSSPTPPNDLVETGKRTRSEPSEWVEWRAQIFAGLAKRRSYEVTPGQKAGEAKQMTWLFKQGYKPDDILKTYDELKLEPFWVGKPLTLMSLAKQIGEKVALSGKPSTSSVRYANG